MKTIILYRSQTGFTERYAKWLAEELGCACIPYRNRAGVKLESYDAVVYGGGFHGTKISGLPWFKKQLPRLNGKTCVVFATGATPAEDPQVEQALARNFTPEERARIRLFYLHSGLCYEKMGVGSRVMMAMFRRMMGSKRNKTPQEEKMSAMIASSFDECDRAFIRPLAEFLKQDDSSAQPTV